MVLLQKHLDSDVSPYFTRPIRVVLSTEPALHQSYPMRNAIIEVITNLIKEISNSEEDQKRELDNFFSLLFDRFLDLNGFVRSKVVTMFLRILDIHTNRFAEARLKLTSLAVRSLEDKTSTVRKNCIALLIKLMLTHPYGALHGGELDLARFQEGYERVSAELAPMEAPSQAVLDAMADDKDEEDTDVEEAEEEEGDDEDKIVVKKEADDESSDEDEPREEREAKRAAARAEQKRRRKSKGGRKSEVAITQAYAQIDQDQLSKLRLTKRYYHDAIAFITELERATPQILLLLASKVKSEVLESMEFFKVAFEYKISSAGEGVKRMLHLIWSKDNSTVEDGQEIRSVRARLIECYRSLYFDPLRDLSPVDNVNRITKNMISSVTAASCPSRAWLMRPEPADSHLERPWPNSPRSSSS